MCACAGAIAGAMCRHAGNPLAATPGRALLYAACAWNHAAKLLIRQRDSNLQSYDWVFKSYDWLPSPWSGQRPGVQVEQEEQEEQEQVEQVELVSSSHVDGSGCGGSRGIGGGCGSPNAASAADMPP
jgi:hypothetical protein